MAGRDFNIPYGPDKTGGFDLSKIVPEVVPTDPQGASQEAASVETQENAPSSADLNIPVVEPQAEAAAADPSQTMAMPAPIPGDAAEAVRAFRESTSADGIEAAPTAPDEASEPAPVEMQAADADMDAPVSSAPVITPDFGRPSLSDQGFEVSGEEAAAEGAEAEDGAESGHSQAIDGVQKSFLALKDSIGQGRELKARERELEDLEDKIEGDREELADRDDILANYNAIVGEQDAIIAQNTQQRDAQKATLAQIVAKTDETSEALERMREYHDTQLDPYETALGRAHAAADQAKNDERSRKSELNAAESEARRAEKGEDATMAQARLDMVKAAHDEALARSTAAKEALDEAQRAYDEIRAQVEQAEAPLERSLEDLQQQTEELKEDITNLGEVISAATKRRQYCDSVYQYPEETEKLRRAIESDEQSARQLDEENEELRGLLEQSKAGSTKAKIVIGAVIAVIILIVLLVWFLSSR